MSTLSKSAQVRARLDHPVIDSDGHTVEYIPAVLDYMKEIGGARMPERFTSGGADYYGRQRWYRASAAERHKSRMMRPPWWAVAAKNTLDRATATLPKLLHERLDEIGLDFTVLYPTLRPSEIVEDAELRGVACRAYNMFHRDAFFEYSDRMTPAAVIPMYTPQEALDELEYAVRTLGFKAVLLTSYVRRPISDGSGSWLDFFGIDSEYDYDPVWAKCVELGVAPSFHSAGMGWGSRVSISNYMYNHIGHFASAAEALAKSLFLGGVTRRFPSLRFAFLECGVAWACALYSDLIGHWQKRNGDAVLNYDPTRLDRELFASLCERYGGRVMENGRLEQAVKGAGIATDSREDPSALDEYARCEISKKEDIRDLYVPNFFFGCEADDPTNAWAFDSRRLPFGVRLNAIFSSDIGHWDVPDMTEVVDEAYELVEHGAITPDDFRDFVFTNPVKLWTAMNPDFFKGTVVEGYAARLA